MAKAISARMLMQMTTEGIPVIEGTKLPKIIHQVREFDLQLH